jgi:hypothetical protein
MKTKKIKATESRSQAAKQVIKPNLAVALPSAWER